MQQECFLFDLRYVVPQRCDFFVENAIFAQPIPPAARLMGEALPEAWNSFIDRIERKESIS